jgi:hypothetical protein
VKDKERLKHLENAVRLMLPIVREAFWDHHTAGMLPGSGYNHRAYHLVSSEFGWRSSDKFAKWHKETLQLIGEGKES